MWWCWHSNRQLNCLKTVSKRCSSDISCTFSQRYLSCLQSVRPAGTAPSLLSWLRSLSTFPDRCPGCTSALSCTWGGFVVLSTPQQLVAAGTWEGWGSVMDAPGSVTETKQTQRVLSTSGRSVRSWTEVTSWAVRSSCLLKDLSAMSLCSLYPMAFIFLAHVPPCLDYEVFNFVKYCMEENLLSSVSKCWPFLLSEIVNMEELLIFFTPLVTYIPIQFVSFVLSFF